MMDSPFIIMTYGRRILLALQKYLSKQKRPWIQGQRGNAKQCAGKYENGKDMW